MSNVANPNASPAPVVLDAGSLRLVFTWQRDRWGHRIERIARPMVGRDAPAERVDPLLESLEGTPDETWPASPVLQSLHVEQRGPGQKVAFLVGMAGASHWSASIELDAGCEQIMFDLACRVKSLPERLGSVYHAAHSPDVGCRFEPLEIDGVIARINTSSAGEWRIEPPPTTGPWPQTIRWKYAIFPVS